MHLNDFAKFMSTSHSLKAPETPPSKQSLMIVRQMPGRPPREMSINHLIKQGGLTRAQAKKRLHDHDLILAAEMERRMKAVDETATPTMSDLLDANRPNVQMAAAMRNMNLGQLFAR